MKFLELEHGGKMIRLWSERRGSRIWIHSNHRTWVYEEFTEETREISTSGTPRKAFRSQGVIKAPMPGKIVKIHVHEGDFVQDGQILIVMEAMKMEYRLCADISGRVEKLSCTEGVQVLLGQQLVLVKETSS